VRWLVAPPRQSNQGPHLCECRAQESGQALTVRWLVAPPRQSHQGPHLCESERSNFKGYYSQIQSTFLPAKPFQDGSWLAMISFLRFDCCAWERREGFERGQRRESTVSCSISLIYPPSLSHLSLAPSVSSHISLISPFAGGFVHPLSRACKSKREHMRTSLTARA
jgi:hypothetical protein